MTRIVIHGTRLAPSIEVHVDHGLGEGLRGFLRQIVPDAALDDPVRIFAGELLAIGLLRWGAPLASPSRVIVGTVITGAFGKPRFQIVIFRLAFSEAEPPAVIMDHDGDVVRVVERRRSAIERGIVEIPFRRCDLPDELPEIVPIFVVAEHAAFSGKIILIPPLDSAFGGNGILLASWLPIR